MMKTVKFITILFVVFTLAALLAHLFELPGKMHLPKEKYRTVQQIYSGWAWFGIFEVSTIPLLVIWILMEGRANKRTLLPLVALLLFVISLILFFLFTLPANTATENWTQFPANRKVLKIRWEYSHAGRAIINLIAFCMLVKSLLGKN